MTTRLTDTESALVADIAAAHRPALVEDWIQESPDLATLGKVTPEGLLRAYKKAGIE